MAESEIYKLVSRKEFEDLSPEEQLAGIKKYAPGFTDGTLDQLPAIKARIKREGMGPFQRALDWLDNPQDNPVPGMQPPTFGEKVRRNIATLGGLTSPDRVSNRLGGMVTGAAGGSVGGLPGTLIGGGLGLIHPPKTAGQLATTALAGPLSKIIPGGGANLTPGAADIFKQGARGFGETQLLHALGEGADAGAEAAGTQAPSGQPRDLSSYLAGPLSSALGSGGAALGQALNANKVANAPVAKAKNFRDMATGQKNSFSTMSDVMNPSARSAVPFAAARQPFAQETAQLDGITQRLRQVDELIDQTKKDATSYIAQGTSAENVMASVRTKANQQLLLEREGLLRQQGVIKAEIAGKNADLAGNAFDKASQQLQIAQQKPPEAPFNPDSKFRKAGMNDMKTVTDLHNDAIQSGERNLISLRADLRKVNRLKEDGWQDEAQAIDDKIRTQDLFNNKRKGVMEQLKQKQEQIDTQNEVGRANMNADAANIVVQKQKAQADQDRISDDLSYNAVRRQQLGTKPPSQIPVLRSQRDADLAALTASKNTFTRDVEDLQKQSNDWDALNPGVRKIVTGSAPGQTAVPGMDTNQKIMNRLFDKSTTADDVDAFRNHLDNMGSRHVEAMQDAVVAEFMKRAYDPASHTFSKAPEMFAPEGMFNADKLRQIYGGRDGLAMQYKWQRMIEDMDRNAQDVAKSTGVNRAISHAMWATADTLIWKSGSPTQAVAVGALGLSAVEWPKLANKIMRDSRFADAFHEAMTSPRHSARSLAAWGTVAQWLDQNSTRVDPKEQEATLKQLKEENEQRAAQRQLQQPPPQQSQPQGQGQQGGPGPSGAPGPPTP